MWLYGYLPRFEDDIRLRHNPVDFPITDENGKSVSYSSEAKLKDPGDPKARM